MNQDLAGNHKTYISLTDVKVGQVEGQVNVSKGAGHVKDGVNTGFKKTLGLVNLNINSMKATRKIQRSKFYKIFKKIDQFGRDINFLHDSSTTYKTFCGSCGTLVMVILLLYYTIDYMVKINAGEIVQQTTYTSFKSEKLLNQQIKINPDAYKKHIRVGLAIKDRTQSDKLYEFNAVYKESFSDSEKLVHFTPCQYADFTIDEEINEKIAMHIHEVACLDMTIGEIFNGEFFLRVGHCTSGNCVPNPQRDIELEEVEIYTFINSYEIDTSSSSENGDNITKMTYIAENIIGHQYYKETTINYQRIVEQRDKSQINNSKNTTNYFTYLNSADTIRGINPEKFFYAIKIKKDVNMIQMDVQLGGLAGVQAFIGGLQKGFALIILAIVFPFREIQFYLDMINELFTVCTNKKDANLALNNRFNRFIEKQTNTVSVIGAGGGGDKRDLFAMMATRLLNTGEEIIRGGKNAWAKVRRLKGERRMGIIGRGIEDIGFSQRSMKGIGDAKDFVEADFRGIPQPQHCTMPLAPIIEEVDRDIDKVKRAGSIRFPEINPEEIPKEIPEENNVFEFDSHNDSNDICDEGVINDMGNIQLSNLDNVRKATVCFL